MRIAAAVLADSASVREGLVSALSLGVNRVTVSEFPTSLRMSAVVVIEVEPAKGRDLKFPVSISLREQGGLTPEVPQIQGEFQVAVENDRVANLPLAVSLDGFTFEAPGVFVVEIRIADLDAVEIVVYADQVDPAT